MGCEGVEDQGQEWDGGQDQKVGEGDGCEDCGGFERKGLSRASMVWVPVGPQGPQRVMAFIPDFLPQRGWSIGPKGYVIYTSRRRGGGIRRGARLHREVMKRVVGRDLTEDEHVHHQDFNKGNCCPCNLVLMPMVLNLTRHVRRCPYTGQWLSAAGWERRFGA